MQMQTLPGMARLKTSLVSKTKYKNKEKTKEPAARLAFSKIKSTLMIACPCTLRVARLC